MIGFDHSRQDARRAAIQAFVVTAIGGLALLAAGILMQWSTGAWELSSLGSITPVGAHLLAKAAYRAGYRPRVINSINDMEKEKASTPQ